MAFVAKMLADSISSEGIRLTTMQLTYPRSVHAELMTHRVFSRNSASSRAIPVEKLMDQIINDPYIPVYWGKNQPGMQARIEMSEMERVASKDAWIGAREDMLYRVEQMVKLGLHKQEANRLLEPWMWITVIVSATEWQNFFNLRQDWSIPADGNQSEREMINPAFPAHPSIQVIAYMARCLYMGHKPDELKVGEWHLPLVRGIDEHHVVPTYGQSNAVKISIGRGARVSYLTHEGKRDPLKDIELYDRLLADGHMSPFEHVAECGGPSEKDHWYGNFRQWRQYRKRIKGEAVHDYGN